MMKGALEKGVARNTETDSTLQIYQAAIEGTREKKQEKESTTVTHSALRKLIHLQSPNEKLYSRSDSAINNCKLLKMSPKLYTPGRGGFRGAIGQ